VEIVVDESAQLKNYNKLCFAFLSFFYNFLRIFEVLKYARIN
jgi:hypothetical protein